MTETISLFPQPLPGWTFSVLRAPKFAQRRSRAISGRTLRVLDQIYPVYEWTLTYEILREINDTRVVSPPWSSLTELRDLMGFYIAMQGSFGPFLFYDPTDGRVTGQQIGIGDGTTTVFRLGRGFSGVGLFEPIDAAIANSDATLFAMTGLTPTAFVPYLDGVATGFGFSTQSRWINQSNAIAQITFDAPPGSGVVVSVDMVYLWPATFSMDSEEFENFLANRWAKRQLRIESFLADGPINVESGGGGVVSLGPSITAIILTNNIFPSDLIGNTAVGNIVVSMSDGSMFTGDLSLGGTDASAFIIVAGTLATAGTQSAGTYSIDIIASGSGLLSFTQHETITGQAQTVSTQTEAITLTNKTFTPNPVSPTNVGNVVVTLNPPSPAFAGTLALSGPDASKFQLTSSTLPSTLQALPAAVGGTTYNINISASDGTIGLFQITTVGAATLSLVPTPTSPSILDTAVGGAVVARLQGVWSNAAPFVGTYLFVAPNFDAGGVYDIVPNSDGSANLIIKVGGPGVSGASGTTETVTVEAQASGTLAPPAGYTNAQLIFEDTFASTSLDTTKWNPFMADDQVGGRWNDNGLLPSPYSALNNGGGTQSSYDNDYPAGFTTPVSPSGNHLVTGSGARFILSQDSTYTSLGYPWAGATITSFRKFYLPAAGGYIQVRAKMPDMRYGAWPAIWLLPGNVGSDGAEFDIIDGGVNRTGAAANTSMDSKWFGTGETSTTDLGVDITADYHIYGFEYKPGVSFKTYFDGTLLHTWTSGVSATANYELILAITVANPSTSGFHNVPDGVHNGPFEMDVSCVQVYHL